MKKVESEDVSNQTLSGNVKKYKEQSPAERLLGEYCSQEETKENKKCFFLLLLCKTGEKSQLNVVLSRQK
jgi:hypothetical protein